MKIGDARLIQLTAATFASVFCQKVEIFDESLEINLKFILTETFENLFKSAQ